MVTQHPDGTVTFRFFRPQAASAFLVGEFNGWHRSSLPMHRQADGWWRCALRLAPGCYQFRYLSDGEWFTDYAAFGVEYTPMGHNSVVKVDPVSAPKPEPVKLPHISQTHDRPVPVTSTPVPPRIDVPQTIPSRLEPALS
jgi:1,4-alpha-glucan branching enzyme